MAKTRSLGRVELERIEDLEQGSHEKLNFPSSNDRKLSTNRRPSIRALGRVQFDKIEDLEQGSHEKLNFPSLNDQKRSTDRKPSTRKLGGVELERIEGLEEESHVKLNFPSSNDRKLNTNRKPITRKLGRVELERIEDLRYSFTAPKIPPLPKRRLSLFDVKDYSKMREERRFPNGYIGKHVVCHSDQPEDEPPRYNEEKNGDVGEEEREAIPVQRNHILHPAQKVDVAKVRKIVLQELIKLGDICKHEHNDVCIKLTTEVKRRLRSLGYERYKYIVTATVGDDRQQGFNMVTKFLWDRTTDTFVSEAKAVGKNFVVVVVYAVYVM